MKESAFIKKNKEKWRKFEAQLSTRDTLKPDKQAEIYIKITDDLSFARSNYGHNELSQYLNGLASQVHLSIYKNKKEESSRFITFWTRELPQVMSESMNFLLLSFIIFFVSCVIGALSEANDENFVRVIMGDRYVNETLRNIESGNPMGIYSSEGELYMFLKITVKNIMVSFKTFVFGLFTSLGTGFVLIYNGIMLGSFQYFFYEKGLLVDSALTIWIHGTLEISAIIIAGAAGLIMGKGLLFPGTYKRIQALITCAKRGIKIIIGLLPVFILAGFLEGFVTRHTELPAIFKLGIILISAFFILYYFVFLPLKIRHGKSS